MTAPAAPQIDPKGPALPIRPEIAELEESRIVDVWRLGFSVPDVIGLWVGEGDLPTPAFICEAATAALRVGETFYTHKRGLPELRQAIADYTAAIHGVALTDDRIAVTSAGMNAMVLVMQTVIGAGDNLVAVTPVWPNIFATAEIMGGEVRQVPLQPGEGGWTLDLDRLFDRCDARTRALYIATPGNPTGWMMPAAQQREVMAFCRRRGILMVADEVYGRFVYEPVPEDGRAGRRRDVAPSFLETAEPDDPLVVVNSFSKAWAMTGWRLGWMVLPRALTPVIERLIEFNTCGAPPFLQRGGIVALRDGEPFVAEMVARCGAGRDLVIQRLGRMRRVRVIRPEAAFYVMFQVEGMTDSLAFAKHLVREARVGLAPGSAFGPGGEGHLRLCFASSTERLAEAMDRLEPLLD